MRKKPQTKKTPANFVHVTPAGRNIFLELGFPAREAQRLLWESDAKIAREQAQKVAVAKKK